VPPIPQALMTGKTKIHAPVVVEASALSTELIVTNWSSSKKTLATLHRSWDSDSRLLRDIHLGSQSFSAAHPGGLRAVSPQLRDARHWTARAGIRRSLVYRVERGRFEWGLLIGPNVSSRRRRTLRTFLQLCSQWLGVHRHCLDLWPPTERPESFQSCAGEHWRSRHNPNFTRRRSL
jgi:hypothetical protein